ncbi:MAG: hypothetical protein GC149_05030 [Gammaproteobacteria bacterium]|nr:hypothetical protein [Gammaproteobacteria bacterium]
MVTQDKQGYRFDRHTPWTPAGHTVKQDNTDAVEKRQSALCCTQCRHQITDTAARLELAGGHTHIFTNPGGFTYEIMLFEYADCVTHGPATTEYTWFPGFAWQLALCANCQAHLGWRYRRTGSAAFYGLIRDRLIEVNI